LPNKKVGSIDDTVAVKVSKNGCGWHERNVRLKRFQVAARGQNVGKDIDKISIRSIISQYFVGRPARDIQVGVRAICKACNPQGPLMEPPKDQQEREKITLQYQEVILRRATANVQRKKQAVVQKTLPKTPAEKHWEFDKKHSKDGPGVQDGGFVYYPNGAYRDINSLGVLCDAVPDRWEPNKLERRIIRYWELRLRKTEDAFNQKKQGWMRTAKTRQQESAVGPPPENTTKAANELKALKQEVLTLRTKLAEARKELDKNLPDFYWERKETNEKNSKENSMFIDALEDIKI
jgi:hypothetical protein